MKNTPREDDSKLVEECINGSLMAWSQLVNKYSSLIYASIENRLKKYGFTLPPQDIEDIKQSVLCLLWKDKKLEHVKNRIDISYWLAIVSGNTAVQFLRNNKNLNPSRLLSLSRKVDDRELSELIPSGKAGSLEELARNEILVKVEESIESLPDKEKLIIKLNILHDKKHDEIAQILNLPKGTVSSYIKRAKEKLRESLKEFK